MEQNQNPNKTEKLAVELVQYLNMKVDAFKLGMVENLSSLFSSALGLMLFSIFAGMALFMFTVAFTYWLGTAIGSMLGAILIVGGFFMLVAIILFVLRNYLISDQMVRVFSKMFFHINPDDDDTKK